MSATEEQERAVSFFLPSLRKSDASTPLKSYLLQAIIAIQAVCFVFVAELLARPLKELSKSREGLFLASALHGSGVGPFLLVCLDIAASAMVPVSILLALIWWLGQQKKTLSK